MKGRMRYVFGFCDLSLSLSNRHKVMVAKETVYSNTWKEDELTYVRSAALASLMAELFNERCAEVFSFRPKEKLFNLEFLPVYLYESPPAAEDDEEDNDGALRNWFVGEPFCPGVFERYTNNSTYIASNRPGIDVLECFCHYTYVATNRKLLI